MIYKGSQKEGKIYKGSNVIKYIYKGSVCVYKKITLGWLAWYSVNERAKIYMSVSSATNLKQYISNNASCYTNNPNNFNNNVVIGGRLYFDNGSNSILEITASFSGLSIKVREGMFNRTKTFTRKPEKDIYI